MPGSEVEISRLSKATRDPNSSSFLRNRVMRGSKARSSMPTIIRSTRKRNTKAFLGIGSCRCFHLHLQNGQGAHSRLSSSYGLSLLVLRFLEGERRRNRQKFLILSKVVYIGRSRSIIERDRDIYRKTLAGITKMLNVYHCSPLDFP